MKKKTAPRIELYVQRCRLRKKNPRVFLFHFLFLFLFLRLRLRHRLPRHSPDLAFVFCLVFFSFRYSTIYWRLFVFFCPRRWFVELVTGLGTVVSLRSTVTYPYMGRPYSPVVHWLSRQPPRAFGLPLVFFFFSFFGLGGSTRSIRRPFLASKSFRVVVWSFFFLFSSKERR